MKKIVIALICMCICLSCFACNKANNNDGKDVPIVYVITFETQNGIIRKEVEDGKSLDNIPALPTEVGYTFTWSVSDFSCITEDMTVSLVKTANEYTIYYDLEGLKGVELPAESQKITSGKYLTLYEPYRACYEFKGWVDEQGNAVTDGKFEMGRDVILKALWEEDDKWSGRA